MALERVEVPITGKILAVNVDVGDKVKEGDVLCIIESMKMENPILAPIDGRIKEVGAQSGKVMQSGELVAVIEY